MTMIGQIVEDAFFEASLTTETQHPTPTQTRRAMTTLAGVIEALYGARVGETLTDWPLGPFGRVTGSSPVPAESVLERPQANVRLLATNESPRTVYLPEYPFDGARIAIVDPFGRLAGNPVTVDGNGRSVEGQASLVLETNTESRTWFFRADLGNWVRITPLLITDEMPFPSEFDRMFVLLLAVQLNPIYGNALSKIHVQMLADYQRTFQNRYLQSAPLERSAEITGSIQSYDGGHSGSGGEWTRGRP